MRSDGCSGSRCTPLWHTRSFIVFAAIGASNTILHLAVVILLMENTRMHAVTANVIAFVVANLFSYWANQRWNFRGRYSVQQYLRFLAVSLAGLALTALITGIGAALGAHYLVGTLACVLILPPLTFLAHRRWTWAG